MHRHCGEGDSNINRSADDIGSYRDRLRALIPAYGERADGDLDGLIDGTTVERFGPGEFVFSSGSACGSLPVVLNGTVRTQLSSSGGRAVTLYRIGPGDCCVVTVSCLLSGGLYPADGVAESQVDLFAVPKATFLDILAQSAALRNFVFNGYSSNFTDLIGKLERLVFDPVDVRLSDALLKLHDGGDYSVTHQQLACELGTAREVISRRLKFFETEGWIRLSRGRITVADHEELRKVVTQSE